MARRNSVEHLTGEVAAIERSGDTVTGVRLAEGSIVGCGTLVNASGPRAAASPN